MEAGRIGDGEEVKGRMRAAPPVGRPTAESEARGKSNPFLEGRDTEASWRLPLVGDEDFRYQGKLILDLGGLLMEGATVTLARALK
jgi:hypothetical protein